MSDSNITHLANLYLLHSSGSAEDAMKSCAIVIGRHYDLLSNAIPDLNDVRPLLFFSQVPVFRRRGAGSGTDVEMLERRFVEIDKQLQSLSSSDGKSPPDVEIGAIETARGVMRQIQHHNVPPPEVAWLSEEAIVMLWSLGQKRYALTITDGELAYIAKEGKKTVSKRAGIQSSTFDILRLR